MILLVESELGFRTKIENHWSKSNEMVPQAVQIVILLDLSNQMADFPPETDFYWI